MSYSQAVEAVTAPGARFELTTVEVAGRPTRAFRNAPSSLRELFDAARRHGDSTFMVYEGERWTFADTMAEVDALAAVLVEVYGIRRGDRVGIAMRNLPEWVVSFAAITSIGAVSVSFNAWWVTDEVDFAIGDATPSLMIVDPERAERAADPCERRGIPLIVARGGSDPLPAGARHWTELVERGTPMPEVEVHGEDDATILYTSGTTGTPKGAVSTHRAICQALLGFSCRGAIEVAREKADGEPAGAAGSTGPDGPAGESGPRVFILIVPLFHVTGCIPVMLGSFAAGLKLVMMYRWDARRALELIEAEKVTQFVGVPTQAWDLLECPDFDSFDTSSLRNVGGGGAPAPPKLVRRVQDGFAHGGPNIGYGMTETNAYGPQNSGRDYLTHPTSTGRGTPIMSVEIRDPDGNPVPVGALGEIWMAGPHLIRGYWNRPDETAETIVDGWLHTGDLGRLDEDGFLYITDRAKDMVLRGGENVYCAEVEAAIYEHPAVYEAAVYGLPHERLGEEVAATVRVREGEHLDADGLREYLGNHLASFKIPSRLHMTTSELPRNASGKMLKRELRDSDLMEDQDLTTSQR